MSTLTDTQPSLSPKVLTTDDEFLTRAVEKWLKFQTGMWDHVNAKLNNLIRDNYNLSLTFRMTIILLSAVVTTISSIEGVSRTAVTLIAGSLTALTGLEAFLKCQERQIDARKQQREIEALRDKLRFEWFVKVEVEGDMQQRLAAAKALLEKGPQEYNEILSKYALKGGEGEKPQVNT
ncbi:MAG TPA: hypothetical protein VJG32_05305 [Anaerolineae bacterium]|nr:hypothetical protein [Anaerolineae bacterium]